MALLLVCTFTQYLLFNDCTQIINIKKPRFRLIIVLVSHSFLPLLTKIIKLRAQTFNYSPSRTNSANPDLVMKAASFPGKLVTSFPGLNKVYPGNIFSYDPTIILVQYRLVHLDVEVRSEELLAPALLCHKEPARASKAPY